MREKTSLLRRSEIRSEGRVIEAVSKKTVRLGLDRRQSTSWPHLVSQNELPCEGEGVACAMSRDQTLFSARNSREGAKIHESGQPSKWEQFQD